MALISVIMPNFNKGAYIESAIRSVLDQSFSDFELIVVDDGSNDNSVSVVEGMQKGDSRVRLVVHEKNRGVSAALNTGIRNVRSKYITFLGSDDLFARERLQRLNDLSPPSRPPSVLYSDPIRIRENTRVISSLPSTGSFRPSGMVIKYLLTGEYRFTAGPITAPKSCFEAVGLYDESLTWGEDFEMSLRLAEKYPLVFDPVSTYGYRIYSENVIKKVSRSDRWAQQGRILEKHLMRHLSDLDRHAADVSFVYLFSCFVASNRWDKILRYGLTKWPGFKAMVSLPERALTE